MKKLTNIEKVGNFLKKRPNKSYTAGDLSNNLKIPKKSVSSSLSRLKFGRNKLQKVNGRMRIQYKKNGKPKKVGYKGFRVGKIRNQERGRWEYFEKTAFKLWKVDFKIIETNTKKPKNKWSDIMDLSGSAVGIVPAQITKANIVSVSATELFRKSLQIMEDEGVSLWKAVREDDSKTVYLGAELINENPLDKNYNPIWDGKIVFVNNLGKTYKFNVDYQIQVNEY